MRNQAACTGFDTATPKSHLGCKRRQTTNVGFVVSAGVIAIEPDVHAVTMGSGQVSSSRSAMTNGHAPAAKKAAPSRTVRLLSAERSNSVEMFEAEQCQ